MYNAFAVPIAQLDNAPPSEGGDCGFESRWARQIHQNACRRFFHKQDSFNKKSPNWGIFILPFWRPIF